MAREDRWGGGGGPVSDGARRLDWAGGTLGFALGGFLDGILFHQILQWHHLLSALDGPHWRSLRVQVVADGLFHAVMYGIALVGLWLLWRSRRVAPENGGKRFGGALLIGFGLWHVADALINHWLLGLHHVRMNARSVLFWDMAFFVAGLVILAAGAAIWRAGHAGSGPGVSTRGKSSGRTAFMLGLALMLAGAGAPRAGPEAEARLSGLDARGGRQGCRAGALLVSGTSSPPDCFAFARPARIVPV